VLLKLAHGARMHLELVLPWPAAAAVVCVAWAGGHDVLSRSTMTAWMLVCMLLAAAVAWRIGDRLSEEAWGTWAEREDRKVSAIEAAVRIDERKRRDAWRPRLMASRKAMEDARDVIARAAMAADKGSPEQARLGAIAARLQGEAIQIKELRL
jgi:hypothetical protein